MEVVDEYARALPAAPLRSCVAWYSGYRQSGVAPAVHRGLPSPFLTLIFTIDEPLHLARHVDPSRPGGLYPTVLGGLHTSPALVRHDGRQSGVQVALWPFAARALLGVPAGSLAQFDDHATLLLTDADHVGERLRRAPTWPLRFAVVDAFLLDRLRAACGARGDVPGEVRHSWTRLIGARGRLRIATLAGETGWSARHLTERFRLETGLTPKAAARVIRFDVARRRLVGLAAAEHTDVAATGRTRAATIAVETGYFDQSHLVREFRALAGCSPTTWLDEQFRNVQAENGAAASRSDP